jgi:hypothetical protein
MTALLQDFVIYAGNDDQPVFAVQDQTGAAINISGVTEIVWTTQRDLQSSIVLTKKKSLGAITFVTDGTDGKFQVALSKTDTAALTGFYLHTAAITDGSGNVTTVTLGRLQVGTMPLWSYSGDPTTSNKDAIRFLIGDTIYSDPQLQDPEINFAYTTRGNIWGAAAMLCRALAAQLSRQADVVDQNLRNAYSQRARAYMIRASDYEVQAAIRSGAMPYAGGISIADKQQQEQDTDRVAPQFQLGMDDNFLPVGPAGNESLTGGDTSDEDV